MLDIVEWQLGGDNEEMVTALTEVRDQIILLKERLPDPTTDGKLVEVKEALEKAFLDGDNPLLADLQFNDAEFQIPNTDVRVNTHGKYIKYGTK